MQKRWTAWTLLVLLILTGCGNNPSASNQEIDLSAFYQEIAQEYGWSDGRMLDVTEELLGDFYPGLEDISTTQLVARMDQMSASVNEIVLMECADETGADTAEEILRQRIKTQAEGGAWYPESMRSWEAAEVIRDGVRVALVACQIDQDGLTEKVKDLFGV